MPHTTTLCLDCSFYTDCGYWNVNVLLVDYIRHTNATVNKGCRKFNIPLRSAAIACNEFEKPRKETVG